MTARCLLFALMLMAMLPSMAVAQDATDQTQDSDQTQPAQGDDQAQPQQDEANTQQPADPVEALQGLWHIDRTDGSAANEAMVGNILKVDRQAITTLSGGTCSSPGLTPVSDTADPKQVGVDITCLGQVLASARWNGDDPDTVDWSEPNLEIVLHRAKGATTAEKPADDSGEDDAQ